MVRSAHNSGIALSSSPLITSSTRLGDRSNDLLLHNALSTFSCHVGEACIQVEVRLGFSVCITLWLGPTWRREVTYELCGQV